MEMIPASDQLALATRRDHVIRDGAAIANLEART
jgi:hypothetical protein